MSSETARRRYPSPSPPNQVHSRSALLPFAMCLVLCCADFERGPRVEASGSIDADAGVGGSTGGEPGMGPTFATDVHPMLLSDCQVCHSSDGSASDTAFLLSSNTNADYQTTTGFVDLSDPLASRLLSKARGGGHQPGAIYSESSDEHQLLLRWISDGALP